MRDRSRDGLAICGLLVLVTVFFLDILAGGLNLYLRDVARTYYPYRHALRTILRAGDFPYWNPLDSAGQPLAANPAYEAFYPPQWLMATGDFRTMFHVVVVLHYPLAAIGMFLLARSLGLSRRASLFAGFTWALGGLLLSLGILFPFLFSAAWLPWVACAFRELLRKAGLARLAFSALTLGMLLLAADVSMILQAGALLAAYAVYYGWKHREWARALRSLALTLLLATLIGAAQLFPAMDHQRDSGRSRPLGQSIATWWSMPPVRPLEMIWPTLFRATSRDAVFYWGQSRLYRRESFPFFLSIYQGVLALILVVTGFAVRARGWRFAGVLCMASFLFAIGRHGPLFPLMYELGFRSMRYPEKLFIAALFVMTAFAAVVADEALRSPRVRRVACIVGAIVTATTAVLAAVTFVPSYYGWFARIWSVSTNATDFTARFQKGMLISLALAAITTILLGAETMTPRLRIAILALTVTVDLGISGVGVLPRITADYYEPPAAARALQHDAQPVRIYSFAEWQRSNLPQPPLPIGIRAWVVRNGLLPNTEMSWGLGGVVDPDPTDTKLLATIDFEHLFERIRFSHPERIPLILQMTGTTHTSVLRPFAPDVVADPRRFDQVQPVEFHRTGNAGVCYFASLVRAGSSPESVGAALETTAPLPLQTAFTDLSFQPAAGVIQKLGVEPNRITLDAMARGHSFLVLAVTAHKYWRATVDGVPKPIHLTNLAFQGIELDAGPHKIEFRYRNPVALICAWVSLLTALAMISILIASAFRRGERRAQDLLSAQNVR
jgi:hypothetical protein